MTGSDTRPVLVTGATGFFGGNLARALAERGERVRVLVRGARRPVALEGLDYEIAEGDLCNERAVAQAVRGCRHVYHAAAQVVFWCANAQARKAVWQVNVDGTRAVLRAAEAAGVERVLHVSTVDTIDIAPAGAIADETTDSPPGRFHNPYADSKREAETLALQAGAVVVNPAFMIGPYDVKPTSGRLLLPLTRSPLVGYPARGGNCFVDVRDAVAGTLAAIERGRRGERYILGGENLTYRAMFARALAVLGRRRLTVPIPPIGLLAAGYLGDAVGRVTGRPPALPSTLAHAAFMDHYYSSARAVRELGYAPTPIDQALRDAFAWYRRQPRV